MDKKITFIFLTLLVGLFLVSCTNNNQQGSKGAFIGGTQGITAEFEPLGVEEEGKFTIYDTESFSLEVTLHNKGEYRIQPNDVSVKLLGPSQDEFTGISSFELKNKEIIDKISDLVPLGGEETISFSDEAKYKQTVTGFVDREWFGNIEYNYKTYIIVPEVCLKEDVTDERVCKVTETKDFFVSGAPITVTAVEESTAGRGIMALSIKVKNVGSGKVSTQTGEFGIRDELAYSLDDPAWECKSGGRINEARLVNGIAEIICKLKNPLAENTISTKQVALTLDYKYRDLIQETLRIKESQ